MNRARSIVIALALASGSGVGVMAQEVADDPALDDGVVVEVRIEGTRRYHENRALGQIMTRPGMSVQQALRQGRDDVAQLERLGPFTNVDKRLEAAPDGGVRIVFTVEEQPYIGDIILRGVHRFSRGGVLRRLRLQIGSYLNPLLMETDRRTIEQHFRERHHPEASVSVRKIADPQTGIATIIFDVEHGPHVKVGDIIYRGLPPEISRRRLNHELINRSGNQQRNLINRPGHPFIIDEIEWDTGAVAGALHDLGFLDARVIDVDLHDFDRVPNYEARARRGPVLAPDGQRDDRKVIVFHIEPGRRYVLGDVTFILDEDTPRDLVSAADMRQAFNLSSGRPFEPQTVEHAKVRALALLREHGYAQARFDDHLDRDRLIDFEAGRVDLVLRLIPGRRYRVRRIDLSGNVITRDGVLRGPLELEPGKIWADRDRQKSLRELVRTGLFSSDPMDRPRIVPRYDTARPAPDVPGLDDVDVEIQVKETSTGSVRLNIGWSTATGIAGQIDYTERNLNLLGLVTRQHWRGGGQVLNAGIKYDEERQSVFARWTNPRLCDGPYGLSLSFDRSDATFRDWDQTRHVTGLRLSRRLLGNNLTLASFYRYTDLKISDVDDSAPDDVRSGKYHLNTIGFNQTYDRLDHPMFPSRGLRVSLEQSLSGEITASSFDYLDLELRTSAYLPLATSDIGGVTFLAISHRNQWLEPLGDDDDIPFFDRIFGGGPSPEHRGFRRRDLGPREINSNGVETRVGGTWNWMSTLELSVPLQGTNEGFRGVIFTDIGQVWGKDESVRLSDLRTAVGFGLRFPAMVLPVKLDFAWLLDPEQGESSFHTHFSIAGFMF